MSEPLFGRDLFGNPIEQESRGALADRFLVPPFTVLNSREGWWQSRKRAWLAKGIESEVGRGEELAYSQTSWSDYGPQFKTGTSVFDPVLCELVYRWFSRPGAQVVDPFADGSVRGVLASMMDRKYWGSELSPEQVAANRVQAKELGATNAEWVCGDSLDTLPQVQLEADLLFSCPPYGDLEVYSDDPADLSTMDYHAFVAAHARIIRRAVALLKPDRFACWVVGDFRCKRGFMRDFTADTVRAFDAAGLHLYDKAILVTSVGSLTIRSERPFRSSRKLGRSHQTILVFVKGNPKTAASWLEAGA